jgi:hypothetical protein
MRGSDATNPDDTRRMCAGGEHHEPRDKPDKEGYSEDFRAYSPTSKPLAAASTWAAVFESTITAR